MKYLTSLFMMVTRSRSEHYCPRWLRIENPSVTYKVMAWVLLGLPFVLVLYFKYFFCVAEGLFAGGSGGAAAPPGTRVPLLGSSE